MSLPVPEPGLVISYAYLWRDEEMRKHAEARKDRPCVVVTVSRTSDRLLVTVAPITHNPPRQSSDAVEIPLETKRRLGLDERRSWAVSTEVNRFAWPGPDIRPISRRDAGVFAFGFVPGSLVKALRQQILARARVHVVDRGR